MTQILTEITTLFEGSKPADFALNGAAGTFFGALLTIICWMVFV